MDANKRNGAAVQAPAHKSDSGFIRRGALDSQNRKAAVLRRQVRLGYDAHPSCGFCAPACACTICTLRLHGINEYSSNVLTK